MKVYRLHNVSMNDHKDRIKTLVTSYWSVSPEGDHRVFSKKNQKKKHLQKVTKPMVLLAELLN